MKVLDYRCLKLLSIVGGEAAYVNRFSRLYPSGMRIPAMQVFKAISYQRSVVSKRKRIGHLKHAPSFWGQPQLKQDVTYARNRGQTGKLNCDWYLKGFGEHLGAVCRSVLGLDGRKWDARSAWGE